jgi:hypothetical protein
MGPRSTRVIEFVQETIRRAEKELGPSDQGVVELRRILNEWIAEREAASLALVSERERVAQTRYAAVPAPVAGPREGS